MNKTEIENKVNLSIIRYSQCWEDTEILLEGLKIKENDICLSIGSAGDNSFSLLTKNPKKVYTLDLNKTQIALIELKKIMYKELNYSEFINFIGIENMNISNRVEIYEKYKNHLTQESEEYWNKNILLPISRKFYYFNRISSYLGIGPLPFSSTCQNDQK